MDFRKKKGAFVNVAFNDDEKLRKMAVSAYVQGKAGAAGADALAETGKGFSQYITVVGLCETVALFALVFSMVALG